MFLEEVDRLDLILIWKRQGLQWVCLALLSTAREGVQGVLEIWKLRWGLEVSHRLYKQSFGLGACVARMQRNSNMQTLFWRRFWRFGRNVPGVLA